MSLRDSHEILAVTPAYIQAHVESVLLSKLCSRRCPPCTTCVGRHGLTPRRSKGGGQSHAKTSTTWCTRKGGGEESKDSWAGTEVRGGGGGVGRGGICKKNARQSFLELGPSGLYMSGCHLFPRACWNKASSKRTRQIIRYRATTTLRRPQIQGYDNVHESTSSTYWGLKGLNRDCVDRYWMWKVEKRHGKYGKTGIKIMA